jgi:sialidase-1
LEFIDLCIRGINSKSVRNVKVMYTGTMSALHSRTSSFIMQEKWRDIAGSQTIWCNPSFATEAGNISRFKEGETFRIECPKTLFPGKNHFYISMEVNGRKVSDYSKEFLLEIKALGIDGKILRSGTGFTQDGWSDHHLGINVRKSGDDGVHSYRIPGLATTNNGTLLAIYDVRYDSSFDLQADIDIGVSRSTDGGRTWEKMRIVMDMGEWAGLPEAQNGVGDPAILVDSNTGEIFIVALWTAGIGNDRAWLNVGQGMTPYETGQLMMVSSKDDGRTWSEPRNITSMVKQPDWHITLQGPGNGITMEDGTLVFAFQHVDAQRVPWSGIMYSKDHGKTWKTHKTCPVRETTESQVAELEPGTLMLNMRNNLRTGRMVYTTNDMGETWQVHESSGKLAEPVCMASLIKVKAEDNILGKDILIFSNPATTKSRSDITIKASLDYGKTWLENDSILLDEENGWGYSCLSMIDRETIGILYESSTGHMTFQVVKITDFIRTIRVKDNL